MPLKIKIRKIHPDACIPAYAHEGDAGFDLHSTENCFLDAGKKRIISTGMAFEIPDGYFGNIRDRSGLAAKYGIHILAGVIDSSYRGEIKVVLINLGKEKYEIKKGDRIAQMLIQKYEHCEIVEEQKLPETQRGKKGFGSTGN